MPTRRVVKRHAMPLAPALRDLLDSLSVMLANTDAEQAAELAGAVVSQVSGIWMQDAFGSADAGEAPELLR